MVLVTERSRDIPSGFLITFSGAMHDDFNVQAEFREVEGLRGHLQRARAPHFVLLEQSKNTPGRNKTQVESLATLKPRGYVINEILWNQLETSPTPRQIERRKAEIGELNLNEDLQVIIDRKLIPDSYLRMYALYSGLEDLSQEYEFTTHFEVHDGKVLQEVNRQRQNYQRHEEAVKEYLHQRDIPRAIRELRALRHYLNLYDEARDGDTSTTWARLIRGIALEGSLFISYGDAHKELPDKIARKLGKGISMQTEIQLQLPEDSPVYKIMVRNPIQNGEDVDFARNYLIFKMLAEMKGDLAILFSNVAKNLSFDETTSLLLPESDILNFFGRHPEVARSGLFVMPE